MFRIQGQYLEALFLFDMCIVGSVVESCKIKMFCSNIMSSRSYIAAACDALVACVAGSGRSAGIPL